MTLHTILKMGNPILRKSSVNLTEDEILSNPTKVLIQEMLATMRRVGGIGLAAPQIGINKSIAVIEVPANSARYPESTESKRYVLFNPEIEFLTAEKQGFWEGCLSVPGLRGFVERPSQIQVKYLDENAISQTIKVKGFLATVFQHELDHLFGKLYVDHIKDPSLLIFESEFHFYEEKPTEEENI